MDMQPLLIWTYHRILPEPAPGAVDVAEFESQIAFLAKKKYRFLDTAGLENWLTDPSARSGPSTMLSFDDGWADNLVWATSILKKYSARAMIAVSTSLTNPGRPGTPIEKNPANFKIIHYKKALEDAACEQGKESFLSWDELSRMRESGIWDIQAHGHSHLGSYPMPLGKIRGFHPEKSHWTMQYALGEPPFEGAPRAEFKSILSAPRAALTPDFVEALKKAPDNTARMDICKVHPNPVQAIETEAEFLARLGEDFQQCRQLFAENLGTEPIALVWPWGQDSAPSRQEALKAGFRLAFTTRKDAVSPTSPRDMLPRIAAPQTFEKFKRQECIFKSAILRKLRNIFGKKTFPQD